MYEIAVLSIYWFLGLIYLYYYWLQADGKGYVGPIISLLSAVIMFSLGWWVLVQPS